MKRAIFFMFIGLLGSFPLRSQASLSEQLSQLPAPEKGYQLYYLPISNAPDAPHQKVEVYIGKEEMIDCNQYFMLGTTQEHYMDALGYAYYKVESKGELGGTLMGCPDAKKRKAFVHLPPTLLDGNRQHPWVFYVPEQLTVRYKIYTAGDWKNAVVRGQESPTDGIPFQTLQNYFVKNTVKLPLNSLVLDTPKKFNAVFGSATVMGKDGKPTPVDFKKEFVVPVILDETNVETSIQIVKVEAEKSALVVHYKVVKGAPITYTIRPFAAIAVALKHKKKVILKEARS